MMSNGWYAGNHLSHPSRKWSQTIDFGFRTAPTRSGRATSRFTSAARLIGGGLLYGERLPPERAFADQFGVSRGTVRDALRRLEEGGFVEKRPGSGTYVTWSDTEKVSIAQRRVLSS